MKILLWVSLLTLGITAEAGAASPKKERRAADSPLHISVEPLARAGSFRLVAQNRGSDAIVVLRPRSGMLDRYASWGGWRVDVSSNGGRFTAVPYPGGVVPFTALDLIELKAGELVGVLVDVGSYALASPERGEPLVRIPGKYSVVVRYEFDQHLVVKADASDFVSVPKLPKARSAPYALVIRESSAK